MSVAEWKEQLADKGVDEWREFIKTEGDKVVYEAIQELRADVEPLEKWKQTKQEAFHEYEQLSPSLIEDLLHEFEPFLIKLPSAHGHGHQMRDLITLVAILHDQNLADLDSIELLTGILGSIFHDLGNAVVERYDEAHHISGHAEIGAFLFGVKAQKYIPQPLLKLVQLTIAAHTHYLKQYTVAKDGETFVKEIYEDAIVDGSKMAITMARQADRSDLQGITGAVRHMITKVKPTEDFTGKEFQKVFADELKDFQHQFMPQIRTEEYRATLEDPAQRSMNVLEHLKMYADSNDGKSPYSRVDSTYIRENVMGQGSLEEYLFIAQDVSLTANLSADEVNRIFEKFYQTCRILEPSEQIEEIIQELRKKFVTLPQDQLSQWAGALKLLTDKLYQEWYERKKEQIGTELKVMDYTLQRIVNNLYSIANSYLEEFSPSLLESTT